MKDVWAGLVAVSGIALVVGTVAYVGHLPTLFALLFVAVVLGILIDDRKGSVLLPIIAIAGNVALGFLVWTLKSANPLWALLGVAMLMEVSKGEMFVVKKE